MCLTSVEVVAFEPRLLGLLFDLVRQSLSMTDLVSKAVQAVVLFVNNSIARSVKGKAATETNVVIASCSNLLRRLLTSGKVDTPPLAPSCTTHVIGTLLALFKWQSRQTNSWQEDGEESDILHCALVVHRLSTMSDAVAQLVCESVVADLQPFINLLAPVDDVSDPPNTTNLQLAALFLLASPAVWPTVTSTLSTVHSAASLQEEGLALVQRRLQAGGLSPEMSAAVDAIRAYLALPHINADTSKQSTQGALKRKRGISHIAHRDLPDVHHWKVAVNAVLQLRLPECSLDGPDGFEGLLQRLIKSQDSSGELSILRTVGMLICARGNLTNQDSPQPTFVCALCDADDSGPLYEQNHDFNPIYSSRCMSTAPLTMLLEQSAVYLRTTVNTVVRAAYMQTLARAVSHIRVPTDPSLVTKLTTRICILASSQLDVQQKTIRLSAM